MEPSPHAAFSVTSDSLPSPEEWRKSPASGRERGGEYVRTEAK